MGSSRTYRRAGTAVLAGLLMGAVLGLTACDGGGEIPSSLPSGRSSERSFERPASDEPEATRSPEAERTTERAESTPSPTPTATTRTQPARTTRPAETTTRPATTDTTTAAVPAATTTRPATTDTTTAAEPTRTTVTPAASPSAAAAAESQDWWPLGWLLLVALLVALVVGGLFVYRSQRRSGWDSEVRALESETRTVTATRLPPVLTTTTTSQRGLVWPPVRMALGDLVSRWDALTERASGEDRRNWSLRISGLLQELIAAVDSENEALAVGSDWTFPRARVTRAGNELASALAVRPSPEPPPAGEPGPTAFPT